jgi:hypothetical protein
MGRAFEASCVKDPQRPRDANGAMGYVSPAAAPADISICILVYTLCSYTALEILQSSFLDIVLPGLGLNKADKGNDSFKLELLIRDVLVTRNWSASFAALSVEELIRGMWSLLRLLQMLQCDAAQLKSVSDAIEACINNIVQSHSSAHLSRLALGSLVRLLFKRHCQRFCDAVGHPFDIRIAVKHFIGMMEKKKVEITPLIAICKNIVVAASHDMYHGKSNGESLSIMVAFCSLSVLLRSLAQVHAFPKLLEADADTCDSDVLHLLVRMQLCDEAFLLKSVENSHGPMYANFSAFMKLVRFSFCLSSASG